MISRTRAAGEKVNMEFSGISPGQLNWKPSPDRWSIGQCLDHLLVSDCLYFPALKKIAAGNIEMSFWEKWSPFAGLFGKMLLHQVQENGKKKVKAPGVFLPAESNIDPGIMERFSKHLDTLTGYLVDCRNMDIDRIHISSPVSKMVTYSLRHAFMILTEHLHRHINQSIRVKRDPGFPG